MTVTRCRFRDMSLCGGDRRCFEPRDQSGGIQRVDMLRDFCIQKRNTCWAGSLLLQPLAARPIDGRSWLWSTPWSFQRQIHRRNWRRQRRQSNGGTLPSSVGQFQENNPIRFKFSLLGISHYAHRNKVASKRWMKALTLWLTRIWKMASQMYKWYNI